MDTHYFTWLKSLTLRAARTVALRSRSRRATQAPTRHGRHVEALEDRTFLSVSTYLAAQPLLPTTARTQASQPPFVTFQGSTYFLTGDTTRDTELWKTDGTAAGTTLVKDLGATGYPDRLLATGTTLYFDANSKLWKSDGTTGNTVSVSGVTNPGELTLDNSGDVFFTTSPNGPDKMWEYTGSGSATTVVTSQYPPGGSPFYEGPRNLINVNGSIFFSEAMSPGPYQLFRYNGTANSITQITTQTYFSSIGQEPFSKTVVGSKLYFAADDYADGTTAHLYVVNSTGTGMTTAGLTPNGVGVSSSVAPVVATNGEVYFVASDSSGNTQIWQTDGTVGGTGVVTNLNAPNSSGADGSSGINTQSMLVANGNTIYFDGDFGTADPAGVGAINATNNAVTIFPNISYPGGATSVGSTLYFSAGDENYTNFTVYKSTGSSAGPATLNNSATANAAVLTTSGGSVFFGSNTTNVPTDSGTPTYLPMNLVTVSKVQGDGQSTSAGSAFTNTLQLHVTATDGTTNLAGVSVTFIAPTSGASGTFTGGVTTATVTTDSNGVATAPAFAANANTGSYTVEAAIGGESGFVAIDSGVGFVETNNVAAPPPSVTALSPSSGYTTGGTSITITGTSLSSATAVYFGATQVTSLTSDSATQIVVNSPVRSAGTVDVTVVTAGGTSTTTASDHFTYITAPSTSISTASLALPSTPTGTAGATTTFTVSGSNLVADIILNAPTGVEMSTDGINFHTSLDLPQSGGTVGVTTISVRIAASASIGSITGNITDTTTSGAEQDIAVTGTVQDNHSYIQLDSTTATINNVAGTVTLTVDRTGNLNLPATMDFATADGTAVAGVDYSATSGTLSFAAGDASKTIIVPLIANAAGAANATFTVTLSNPTGSGVLGGQNVQTVTVQNNRSLANLTSTSYSVANDTGTLQMTVTRTGNLAFGGNVYYTTTDGTALAGSDYVTTSGMLTFASGDASLNITIPLIPNAAGAPSSSFTLTISANAPGNIIRPNTPPAAIVVGTSNVATVTLANNHSLIEMQTTSAAVANDDGTVPITIDRTGNLGAAATIDFTTTDGTALAGVDYTGTAGTFVFAPGESSKTVFIPLIADAAGAASSSFSINLSNATGNGVAGGANSDVITEANNHSLLQVDSTTYSINNVTATVTITVDRTGNLSAGATVDYATSDGTAVAGTDYTAASGTITFMPGDASASFTVPLIANAGGAPSSAFNVTLSNATGSGVVGGQNVASVTVSNTRSLANFASTTYSANNDAGTVTLTVLRSGDLAQGATVYYTTANGTALSGTDYTGTSGSLVFTAGDASETITVPLVLNPNASPASTFTVSLYATSPFVTVNPATPSGVVIGSSGVATVTLNNNFSQIQLDSATASVSNDAGTVSLTVDRTGDIDLPASVSYATSAGTAVDGVDYTGATGVVDFAIGESSKTISVPVIANAAGAATSTFALTLSAPGGNGELGTQTSATVTVQNNHSLIQMFNPSYSSPNTAVPITVTVARSGNLALGATMDYATSNGTATAGVDYTAASGTLTFQPGDATATFTVSLIANAAGAPTSTFDITLSNATGSGVLGTAATSSVTVLNNRSLANLNGSTFSADNTNGFVAVNVVRTGNTTISGRVYYSTVDGTAIAGTDYVATAGVINFAAGETSRTIDIPTIANAAASPSATLGLVLSATSQPVDIIEPASPVNTVIGSVHSAVVTLTNSHSLVQIASASYSISNDLPTVTVTVSRTGNISLAGTVAYTTADGTALAGTDYTAASGTVTFAAGQSSRTIVIPLLFAPSRPASATFTVSISSPGQNAVLGTQTSTAVTITNAHSQLSLITESSTATTDDTAVTITLTRAGNLSQPISFHYATANGTALAGVDYTAVTGTTNFAEGQTTLTITVPLLGNFAGAATSAFTLQFSAITGGGVLPAGGAVTINITNAHSVVQFDADYGQWAENYGLVNVTVSRNGNVNIPATVDFATIGGTAVDGKNYNATSGTLHFAAGQSKASYNVTYIEDYTVDPLLFVNMQLTNPTAGMVLGRSLSAIGIVDLTPPPAITNVNPITPPTTGDVTAPAASLTLTFNQPLIAAPAASDFTLAARSNEGANGTGKSTPLALKSVTYDPTTHQLVVVPTTPLKNNTFYQLTASGSAATNLNGQSLGTPYVSSFGKGRHLTYIDRDGNRVNLVLKGPGIIQLTRTSDGQGETLSVLGATSKTRLTGTAKHTRMGGNGTTTLSDISGLDSKQLSLRGVGFVVSTSHT